MSLLNYLPKHEEVNRCIKLEAEAVSDEVLLAVHQEFPLAYAKIGPDGKVVNESRQLANEEDLLRHLLGSAPSGSLVVPITGASGVGKSHLIRILDARLRRLSNASSYLVIRIPKSASLRRVVELILEAEPLQGNNYDLVRAEFEKALIDLPLTEAVIRFQAELKIALGDYAAQLYQELLKSPTDEMLKRRLHVARGLPLLLADATTVSYFNEEVLPRIIHRPVEGLTDVKVSHDPTDCQFKPADFDLSEKVDISRAAIDVKRFFTSTLSSMGGEGKVIAAYVLNKVVDQSTRQLYQLNQTLGGKTLSEVIGDIRRLLFLEDPNKELIILVEDFAALIGIQDTLAKILIQHGVMDGQRTLATIRSVIAVTDGYLAGRDTLATRAGREWVVESRLQSEAEVLLRTRRLVASYLNAARHGEVTLKEIYRQTRTNAPSENHGWGIPIFSDASCEDETALTAFGDLDGIPLFPFTLNAIDCLARSALTAGNALVFTPRFVIDYVIRFILLDSHNAYVKNQFPPASIIGKSYAAAVAQWLTVQPISADDKNRYERFISIWGNNPKNLYDITCIPEVVFQTFGLPLPNIEYIKALDKGTNKPLLREDPPEMPDGNAQKIQTYHDALERWVQNDTRLEQSIANDIRKSIATLMNQRIDWNAECCLKQEVRATKFSIPNAGGEQGLDAHPIRVSESTKDSDGRLRGDLLALLRYVNVYQRSTNYDNIEDDLARVGNFIDRLKPEVIALTRVAINRRMKSAIALLALNGSLLGLMEKGRTLSAVSIFLFGDVKLVGDLTEMAPKAFKDWRQLQRDAFKLRELIIPLVLETSGCFQGIGKTPYGVDIVGILECYPDESSVADLSELPDLSPELRSKLMMMRSLAISTQLKLVLEVAKKTQALATNELGAEFDKQVVVDTVKAIATNLREMGVWSINDISFSANTFIALCETFRSTAVKEALTGITDLIASTEEPANRLKQISRVAQLPLEPLLTVDQFINDTKRVIRAAANHAQTLEKQYKEISPDEQAKELAKIFTNLEVNLGKLQ